MAAAQSLPIIHGCRLKLVNMLSYAKKLIILIYVNSAQHLTISYSTANADVLHAMVNYFVSYLLSVYVYLHVNCKLYVHVHSLTLNYGTS